MKLAEGRFRGVEKIGYGNLRFDVRTCGDLCRV